MKKEEKEKKEKRRRARGQDIPFNSMPLSYFLLRKALSDSSTSQ
jgi:hypothetical protein